MDYKSYLRRDIEKALFIEIGKDIPVSVSGSSSVLKKGEYPILPQDMMKMAESGVGVADGIQLPILIDGMIYVVGCDDTFKYTPMYKEFLLSLGIMESYLIKTIEENKNSNKKKALIYLNTLCELYPKKENLYNRIVQLMNMFEETSQKFLEDEIVKSLEDLCEKYKDFSVPHYNLGEYYINKDMDKAKVHLRKCLDFNDTRDAASVLLERIKNVEKYDEAVEKVKEGKGEEVLSILCGIVSEQPNNLDALYYLCVALRQSMHYEKALMYLKELSDKMERQEVYAEIALNLAALSEYEAAIEYFRKALKIKPDDGGIICNIGVCQLSLGEVEEAKKTFELATRINKDDEIANSWLKKIKEMY